MSKYYSTAIVGIALIVSMLILNNSLMNKAEKYVLQNKIETQSSPEHDTDGETLRNEFVIVTWKDNHYHKPGCVHIKGAQDELLLSDAIRFECEPCPWCMVNKK